MIIDLITDYLASIEKCLMLFDQKFGRRDLVRAWREGTIPQHGRLGEDVEYQMHGVGCAVEFPNYDVDFDFANQFEVGFDAWRLWRYAKQFSERYPAYQGLAVVKTELADCLSTGRVLPVEGGYAGESNGSLLQLK